MTDRDYTCNCSVCREQRKRNAEGAELVALRARVATLEGDLNVARLQLGARACSECPAKARVAELEAVLQRIVRAGEDLILEARLSGNKEGTPK